MGWVHTYMGYSAAMAREPMQVIDGDKRNWLGCFSFASMLLVVMLCLSESSAHYKQVCEDLGGYNYTEVKRLQGQVETARVASAEATALLASGQQKLAQEQKKFTYRAKVKRCTITYYNGKEEEIQWDERGLTTPDVFLDLDHEQ